MAKLSCTWRSAQNIDNTALLWCCLAGNTFYIHISLTKWSLIYSRAIRVKWCSQYADWWGLTNLLEVRWSMIRDLITCSIIFDMQEKLEIGLEIFI